MNKSISPARPLTRHQVERQAGALQLLQASQVREALELAWALAREAPDAPDAHQLLAMCLAEDGQTVLAESAFVRALELSPDNPLVLLNYGTLLKRSGDFARAASCFAACARAAPHLPKGWHEFGLCMQAMQRLAEAQAALEKALSLQPEDVAVLIGLAGVQREMDQLEAAEATLLRATTLAPDNAVAWANLGGCRRLLGRSDLALECYQRASRLRAGNPIVEDALTGALLDCGELAPALSQAKSVVDRFPDFIAGQQTLSQLRWEFADDTEASPFASLEQAVRERPQHSGLRYAYARVLLDARQAGTALEQARRLRQLDDSFAAAQLEAECLDAAGEGADAAALFAALATREASDRAGFLAAHARHLLRSGRLPEAESQAQAVLELNPIDQSAWSLLSTIWRLLDDPREHWLCDYERLVALVEVPVPSSYADRDEFLAALRQTLQPLHFARREPIRQSVRGGSQTPGRLFGRNDPVLMQTRDALLSAVEGWIAGLGNDPRHPFLSRRARKVRVSGSWSVNLWSSGSHANHFHPEGWISSAFYVTLPPSVTADTGDAAGHIQFGQPPEELGLDLPPRRVIRPEAGKLALFPSYLWHGTVPFADDAVRTTIAFDMIPGTGA